MKDIIQGAPNVVAGKVLSVDESLNSAEFLIICVYKWESGNHPDTINISEAVFVNSCSGREAWKPDQTWIAALSNKDEDAGTFSFYEPATLTRGAFVTSKENLAQAAEICENEPESEVEEFSCQALGDYARSLNDPNGSCKVSWSAFALCMCLFSILFII